MVKNPSINAGDMGWIPGLRTYYIYYVPTDLIEGGAQAIIRVRGERRVWL